MNHDAREILIFMIFSFDIPSAIHVEFTNTTRYLGFDFNEI